MADPFGDERRIERALMEKGRKVTLLQTTKGERDIAVAARQSGASGRGPASRPLEQAAVFFPSGNVGGSTASTSFIRPPADASLPRRPEAPEVRRWGEVTLEMPKFIDAHPMKPFSANVLKQLQSAPKDEFGITHHDILFNEKENKIYCVLNAPNKEAVDKHHKKAGLSCDWIHEVHSTRE